MGGGLRRNALPSPIPSSDFYVYRRIEITVWDRDGKGPFNFIENYVGKGSKILVEGEIRYRTYEKDGVEVKATEIVAHRVHGMNLKPPENATETPDDGVPF